jgi:DNA-directed RNA polymerase subunit RPC12/RpoP
MEKVKCIKCGEEVTINIANAQDENGEVFVCPNCGQVFRYTHK